MILIIVTLILALDQLTKFVIIKNLAVHQSVPVIKGLIHFTLVYNRGAAFGILKNQVPLFVFAALLAIILIYFSLKGKEAKKVSIYSLSLALILAGAIGNLIDRLRFAYVVDFLDFRIWPVFNIADSAITIGAILLGYTILFDKSAKP